LLTARELVRILTQGSLRLRDADTVEQANRLRSQRSSASTEMDAQRLADDTLDPVERVEREGRLLSQVCNPSTPDRAEDRPRHAKEIVAIEDGTPAKTQRPGNREADPGEHGR
jgi:hypothetical protein